MSTKPRGQMTQAEVKTHIREKIERGDITPGIEIFDSPAFTLAFANMVEAAALLRQHTNIDAAAASLMLGEGKNALPLEVANRLEKVYTAAFNLHRDSANLAISLDELAALSGKDTKPRMDQVVTAQGKLTKDLTYRNAISFMQAETQAALERLPALTTDTGLATAIERLQAASASLTQAEKQRTSPKEGK